MEGLGFYIGPFFVAYYGLFIVLGIAASSLLARYQIRRYGLSGDDFMLIALLGGTFGMLGAKLLFLIVSRDQIDLGRLTEPAYLMGLLQGGFVFYGGLIGGFFGVWLSKKVFALDPAPFIRYCIPVMSLVHAFGRLGCAKVGCCYGVAVSHHFSVVYTHSFFAPNHQPLFPVQLVESFALFLIVIFLLYYINFLGGSRGLAVYIALYAVLRFVLEFFRGDRERGLWNRLSTSQYISLGCLLILFFCWLYGHFPKRITPD